MHERRAQTGHQPRRRPSGRRHPDRPTVPQPAPPAQDQQQPPAPGGEGTERLTEQHNVRIRPSVKNRLGKAVDKLRYETGDRTISIASITDQALDAYLAQRGC